MEPPFAYMGGKSKLAPFIVSNFPPHSCYCEVFGGGASVLFYKPSSQVEVYNDINRDLVNVFMQIKNNFDELHNQSYWLIHSREIFAKFSKNYQGEELSWLERAVRFLYLNKNAFSGQFMGGIGMGPYHKSSWSTNFVDGLKKYRQRLDRVTIECLDFQECIEKYDRPDTLFYLDPPYFVADSTLYYKFVFHPSTHKRFRQVCGDIKGKFILSYDDHPEVRKLYENFNIINTPQVKKVSSTKEKKDICTELIIMNFEHSKQERIF